MTGILTALVLAGTRFPAPRRRSRSVRRGADAVIAVARRETVTAATAAAALPETRRTYLQFSDGDYSGCNLFLLATAGAARAVRLWAELEALRKRPLALVQRLGVAHALRYQSGRLSLPQALTRLGELSGASLGTVALSDGLAAIDVDKPEDLETVRRLIEARER